MSRQVIPKTSEQRLQRLHIALELELLAASDAEVRQAASDIGIDPDMKGSIAWLGIFFPSKVKLEEVFDMDGFRRAMQRRLTPPKKPE